MPRKKTNVSSLEGKYAIVICVITLLTALVSSGFIISDVIKIIAIQGGPNQAVFDLQRYSSLITSGTFLGVSLFAYALHRPMLNNDH